METSKPDGIYAALAPTPFTILGLKLRPLSLGHMALLHRIDSPFVAGDSADLADLALGVFICHHRFSEALDWLDRGDFSDAIADWFERLLTPTWRQRIGLAEPQPLDFDRRLAMFREYLGDNLALPTFSMADGGGGAINAEAVQLIRVGLMRELGLTDEQIMDRSWALCLWDWVTIRAMDRQISLVDSSAIDDAMETARALAEELGINGNGKT